MTCNCPIPNFIIYEKNMIFFFYYCNLHWSFYEFLLMCYRVCTRGELGSLRSGPGQIYALHLTHQKVLFLCFNAGHYKHYYFLKLQWMKCWNVGEMMKWCAGAISFVSLQSRQSAKLFLQSLELGLPHPLTRRRVCPPLPPPGSGGRVTLACGRGGGGSQSQWGDILVHCGTLGTGIYRMYFVVVTKRWPINPEEWI